MIWKFTNAVGGFWDSLDSEERRLLVVYGAYLVATLLIGMHSRSRERLKRDIVAELEQGRL